MGILMLALLSASVARWHKDSRLICGVSERLTDEERMREAEKRHFGPNQQTSRA